MNEKEQHVMDNFDLSRPDPADFAMGFMIEQMRQGLSAAQALQALIEHKRKPS
ncbi:hypothetical protein LCG56_29960 (plasmid) [Pseudomonas cannabina pv. alisalensis]|uniref:Uncharacterized protein n=2 Tax=Pseudomonas syringae pv. maculicola TaxID=59511 RepID=A0A8T8CB70_PSEYM|nr:MULTISPECIES: hypothetical protein [Pseudomonas syringae group]QHF00866.1 hypothetical protein PMA4326_030650 [Pseudomonas syringae pv. maculicola str. ES4326]UBZ00785.1 hypothetical protein LCG56_29960 [Pseudomonas cannabina pv. alisalensis]